MQILHFFFLSLWVIMRTCAITSTYHAVYQCLILKDRHDYILKKKLIEKYGTIFTYTGVGY